MSMNQTLSQQRAAAAWKHVTEGNLEDGKYAPLVKGTPAHIHINGLGQTLAFYLSKQKKAHRQVMTHVAQWVLRSGTEADESKRPEDLLDAITGGDSDRYRTLTRQAMAYLDWLKRFAEAASDDSADAPEDDGA